jgi:hypothetical protein
MIGLGAPRAVADLQKGARIEVKTLDQWETGTVVRAANARVLVKFEDDGRLEWIAAERLHAGDAAELAKMSAAEPPAPAAPSPAPAAQPSPAPAAAPPAPATPASARVFSVGEAIEFKEMNRWRPGHIEQVVPHWLIITDDPEDKRNPFGSDHKMHWIQPWGVRVVGSAYELEGFGAPIRDAQPGEVAPVRSAQNPAPSTGDQFTPQPAELRPIDPETFDHTFEPISFDNSQSPAPAADAALRLALAPVGSEFSAWALRGVKPNLDSIHPCLGPTKVAVACFKGAPTTIVIRTNLLTHSQMDTRTVPAPDITILAAGDDGDSLASSRGKNLQYWKWSGTAYKLAANLQIDAGGDIRHAYLLGGEHAIVETGGDVYLIDLQAKRVMNSTKIAGNSNVYVHPSGQIVGVITSDGTAMLMRASDFSIINQFEDAGTASNISVDPTGTLAAYLSSAGAVQVVKIADKTVVGHVNVGASFRGRIDLVDDKFLLVDNSTAYDIKGGIPVWIYRMPMFGASVAPLASGQFVIAAHIDRGAAVAVASIPDQVGRAALKGARPADFILSPGTAIKIDCDFGPFGAEKDPASQVVTDAVKDAGLKISSDANEAFHLTSTIIGGKPENRDYSPGFFGAFFGQKVVTINVPCNTFTATLTYKGTPVWTQQIRFEIGNYIQLSKTQSPQEMADAAAQPRAAPLHSLNLPRFLPPDAKPGSPAALGASTLQDRRFVPDKPVKTK